MKIDQKVYKLLKENNSELSQKHIADSLGVSRVTINKSIQRLKNSGVIKVKQNRIKGKFATCLYTLRRVNPTFNNSNIINNYITKKKNINRIIALLSKNRCSLTLAYYIHEYIDTLNKLFFIYETASLNINSPIRELIERPKGALLLDIDNNLVPP